MIQDAKLIEQVDAYVDGVDVEELHPDVRSLVAVYRSKREDEDERGAYAFARAISKRVDVVGAPALEDMTVAELKAELERRNADRADDAQIVPDGTKKADLLAALQADDEA